jgi:hypothetical protein
MLVMGTVIVGLLVIIAVLGTLLLKGNQPNSNTAVLHAQATLTAVPTATPRPFTIIGTFQGVEYGQTSIFFTSTNWVLAWSCDPIINGKSGTYPLTIADEADPTNATPTTSVLVQTTCKPGNASGMVEVFVLGEQRVWVGTANPNEPGDPGVPYATWKVVIEVVS